MFGWDWGAQLPDIGIWRDLYLECYNAGRIDDVVIRQKHTWKERPKMGELSQEEYIEAVEQSDIVSLNVEVKPEQDTNLENTKVIVTLTDPNGVQLEQVVLPTIKEAVCAEILVAQPKLWWCNGLGISHCIRCRYLWWITISVCLIQRNILLVFVNLQSAQRRMSGEMSLHL